MHETVNYRLSSYNFWFKDLIDGIVSSASHLCLVDKKLRWPPPWRSSLLTNPLVLLSLLTKMTTRRSFSNVLKDIFCMIWTHSVKVPSASTPWYISIKWSRPTRIDQIHRRLMILPNYVQKTNSWIQVDPTDGSDRPGGNSVTEPPPARGARSNVLDICFQEL